MRILGIDPGKTGAFAIYNPLVSAASGLRWVLWDVPILEDEVDVRTLRDILRKYSPDLAVLERVGAMPSTDGGKRSMGAVGAFNFGDTNGSIRATLLCCDIPLRRIVPAQWKRFHLLLKSDKEKSRQRALDLFPEMASSLNLKKHQNRAEAMLIAAYGADKYGALLI